MLFRSMYYSGSRSGSEPNLKWDALAVDVPSRTLDDEELALHRSLEDKNPCHRLATMKEGVGRATLGSGNSGVRVGQAFIMSFVCLICMHLLYHHWIYLYYDASLNCDALIQCRPKVIEMKYILDPCG